MNEATAPMATWLAGGDLDALLAWRDGQALSRRQYLADLHALAGRLPPRGALLALTNDRYRFALALGAAVQRGQFSLMPPNSTPDTLARLHTLFPDAYAVVDDGTAVPAPLPGLAFAASPAAAPADAGSLQPPVLQADSVIAQVLTSGSTGAPVPHAKRWGLLARNIDAEAARLARYLGRPDMHGVSIVGTVPPQHMYGFESTVMLALRGGAAFACDRPFYPAQIAASLAAVPRPRMLVTTPFHLKALAESGTPVPPLDLIVSATAPLSPQLAQRAEALYHAPLVEIYGCTEAGQVATRRSSQGAEWETFDGLRLSGDGDATVVQGGHVEQPTTLADVIECLSPTRFRLLGRSNDIVNIAGKRSSLGHLNFHLNSIPGVRDGVFWLPHSPAHASPEDVIRLVALVAADGLTREALLAALRERIEPAFLPRRIVWVDSLPRDATGKLPAERLAALATSLLAAH